MATATPLIALALFVTGFVLAFGVRSFVQWRRTGDTGLRLDAGPAGSLRWWAKLLFVAAIGLGLAAPVVALAGLAPLPSLGRPAVAAAGFVLAAAGVTATLLAQLGMGDSWRIGVDTAERTALVTGGAFALVRNPIFTAITATSLGLALMVPNVVSLVAVAALVVSIQLQVRLVEEPYLVRTHGAAYLAYVARVGRFLPGLGRSLASSERAGPG